MENKEKLHRFFANQSSPIEQQEVLDWVEQSPENMQEMIAERKLFDMVLLNYDFDHQKGHVSWLGGISKQLMRQVASYAAVAAVVMVGAFIYIGNFKSDVSQMMNKIEVPAGQRVDLTLSDGTKVCLNALSTFEYPAYFGDAKRNVKLTGEAFFEVAHNPEQPFVVETFDYDVEVLGTTFDLVADPATKTFSTSLLEGSVRINPHDQTKRSVLLEPNFVAQLRNGKMTVGKTPEYEKFVWRDGIIAFNDKSFMDLISTFERQYGVAISVRNPERFDGQLYSGKIRVAEGINHAMWVLHQNAEFEHMRSSSSQTIMIY